jgi:hypothetical protein
VETNGKKTWEIDGFAATRSDDEAVKDEHELDEDDEQLNEVLVTSDAENSRCCCCCSLDDEAEMETLSSSAA